jgi:hypothetical protein
LPSTKRSARSPGAGGGQRTVGGKKNLFALIQAEIAREVDRLIGRIVGQGQALHDLEATEMAIRASMHQVGAMLLGQLLQADVGDRAARVACGRGHEAVFVEYRTKAVQTVLGSLTIRRAYYHCAAAGMG